MTVSTDQESLLIERWQQGDDRAFDQLFELHFNKLYRFALRHINQPEQAEEMAMDLLTTVWNKKHEFKGNKTLSFFLFHALKRSLIDHYRKKRLEFIALDNITVEPQSENTPDGALQNVELKALYDQGLARLSMQRRLVYEMKEDLGMTYLEIARALNISPNTVNRHLVDAVFSVRSYVRRYTDIVLIITVLFPWH